MTPACRSSAPYTEGSFTVAGRQLCSQLYLVCVVIDDLSGRCEEWINSFSKNTLFVFLSTFHFLLPCCCTSLGSPFSSVLLSHCGFEDCLPSLIFFFFFSLHCMRTSSLNKRETIASAAWDLGGGLLPVPGTVLRCESLRNSVMPHGE